MSDFADKILWLLDHPESRQTMGQFGLKRVSEKLAWEYSVPNLLSAYERAFSKRANDWLPAGVRGVRRESGKTTGEG